MFCFDNIVLCLDNIVLCFDNFVLCFKNIVLCFKTCLLCLQIWATVLALFWKHFPAAGQLDTMIFITK